MKSDGAVITGLGAICAAGRSVKETMSSLYAGECRPQAPQRIQVDLQTSYPVFEIQGSLEGIHETRVEQELTRTSRLALIAAEEALRHARLGLSSLRQHRVGICLGTTVGCTLNSEPFYRQWRANQQPGLRPIHRYLQNNPALVLADLFGLSGPVATIANACSSGTDAIGLAKGWIETGRCDMALAGGCDELSRLPYLGFISLLITAPEPCRPFDKNRRGLNLGEGAGVVVLERESSARARKATELVQVGGYGTSADAFHPTAPHPEGLGLARAIREALKDCDQSPDQVGLINAHGTGTPENDRIEGRVLRDMFPEDIPVVATKSCTGHTLGAAGGLEAVFTVQALLDQQVPPTAGFKEGDPEIGLCPTRETVPVHTRAAISTSLAFGGNNSVLVFQGGRA